MTRHLRNKRHILEMGFLAAVSVFWLVIKTGKKPSRIVYPCQRAAVANVHFFLLALLAPLIDLRSFWLKFLHSFDDRKVKAIVFLSSLLIASGAIGFTTDYAPTAPKTMNPALPVQLDLRPQSALTSTGSSDLFLVQNVSGVNGDCDTAISTLLSLMQNHGLYFYKTSGQPNGLIAKDDVVLIKVNAVGPERAGTNTDLVKSLIKKIVNHPEGFIGEVVVADNGQNTGGLDLAESNAFDHSQSFQDVVNMFGSFKVSAWSWYTIRSNSVNEYDEDDFNDGYVVNSTENPTTHLRASYPKFKTKYGTHISLRNGIWSTATNSYDSQKLKVINVPVLKSHYDYGVTAAVKNYMGVVSQTLTNTHDQIKYGALGTEIAETRFPIITLLDAIWVNANPKESGSNCGPPTPYEVASYTNVLGASQDLVALECWASKHILVPAAIENGHTSYLSLNPDYAPVTPGLTESYHNYLEKSMNELKGAGYQVTMNESQMNVYVATAEVQPNPIGVSVGVHGASIDVYLQNWAFAPVTLTGIFAYANGIQLTPDNATPTVPESLGSDPGVVLVRFAGLSPPKAVYDVTVTLWYSFEGLPIADGFWRIDVLAPSVDGDVTNDGVVDIFDIIQLSAQFSLDAWMYPDNDVVTDCAINVLDAIVVSTHFGQVAP